MAGRGWLLTAGLLTGIAMSAGAAPTIEIASVPAYGASGSVTGSVSGVAFALHRVAAYIYIDGLGWYTKPTFASPMASISGAGSFSIDVTTGGVDDRATIHCVALVPSGAPPPTANGAVRIPAALAPLALDCRERWGRTLPFAGLSWAVKETPAAVGPNGNWFSDSVSSVWVDTQGLHLKIRFDGTRWTAAEVVLIDAALRGKYGLARIQTESRLDVLDANATFGFFSWDPYGDGSPVNPSRELDIEDSRWGNAVDPTGAQFAVQPFTTPGNLVRYALPELSGDARLTRLLRWLRGEIVFTALRGAQPATGFPAAAIIREFVYAEDAAANHLVPDPGRSALRLNLWLNDPAPLAPASGQEVEVVITDFSFEPDRCPWYAGHDPTDTDGNGRGDACECGDQNDDGTVNVLDLIAINQAIFTPSLVTPLCDGNGDGSCDVKDMIAANLEIFSPGNTSTCARQPVPGP